MCSLNIIRSPHLRDVHHGGADGDRDGLRRWRYFREHVTRIVAQPLGLPVVLGVMKAIEPPTWMIILGTAFLRRSIM